MGHILVLECGHVVVVKKTENRICAFAAEYQFDRLGNANDVSIFDIWKGTFLDSEIAIDEESAHDESEDMARNGAVVSITFGILVTFILVIETLFGWKMCCEKWIVGLLALCACVSQGVTFLFFNSERYW